MRLILGTLLTLSASAMASENIRCFDVDGMTCSKCVEKITGKLKGLKGVKEADVSLVKATVKVHFEDKITPPTDDALIAAMKEIHYTATSVECK